jgi:hypothetical protein
VNLFLLSAKNNLEILDTISNQAVIQLKTGQAWWYLSGEYVPFSGGYPVEIDNVISVFINGILVNDKIDLKSFSITDSLNEKVNTCKFNYRNDGDLNNDLEFGMSIVVFDYNLEKIFAGQILDFDKQEEGDTTGYIEYSVSCSGWEKKLQTKKVAENYQNQTCKEIIVDIFIRYLPEFGTSFYVQDGIGITTISFNYVGIDECLKKLADIAEFEWYVDYEKEIHFFTKQTNIAPVLIEKGGKFSNFSISIDGSQIKNSIILRGGYYLEEYLEDIQVADGERTNFLTAYSPFSPVKVYVDSGAGFVEKTVGTKNLATTGYDFVVSFSEKNIENLDAVKLNAGDIIKITYKRQVPVIAYGEDTVSIERMKALQGGDGKFEDTIVDTTIEDLDLANQRIQAELISYANTLISGSLKTDISGFKSGQILTINLPSFALNYEQVLIQSVQTRPKTNKQADDSFFIGYTINFATSVKGLQEFLLDLYKKGKEIAINENEVVNTFFQKSTDKILFENDTIEQTQHATGIYHYDASDALYDFAEWS